MLQRCSGATPSAMASGWACFASSGDPSTDAEGSSLGSLVRSWWFDVACWMQGRKSECVSKSRSQVSFRNQGLEERGVAAATMGVDWERLVSQGGPKVGNRRRELVKMRRCEKHWALGQRVQGFSQWRRRRTLQRPTGCSAPMIGGGKSISSGCMSISVLLTIVSSSSSLIVSLLRLTPAAENQ